MKKTSLPTDGLSGVGHSGELSTSVLISIEFPPTRNKRSIQSDQNSVQSVSDVTLILFCNTSKTTGTASKFKQCTAY